jgi:hypothetical protein
MAASKKSADSEWLEIMLSVDEELFGSEFNVPYKVFL